MPINYIPSTSATGYGKLESTDPNPNSREFFREIVKEINNHFNLGYDISMFEGTENDPRAFGFGRGCVLHLKRRYGTHEFEGVILTVQGVPQTRAFGNRYSATQRRYTYNSTSRTFLFRNLIPALTTLMAESERLFAQRSIADRAREELYAVQRRQNEECQRTAREYSISEANGDTLNYYGDREQYRIVVYLNKYQVFKVLKAIQTVKSLVPANAGG